MDRVMRFTKTDPKMAMLNDVNMMMGAIMSILLSNINLKVSLISRIGSMSSVDSYEEFYFSSAPGLLGAY